MEYPVPASGPDQQLTGGSARSLTVRPHQTPPPPAASFHGDEDASDSSTVSLQPRARRSSSASTVIPCVQTRSPGSASSQNQHPPIFWLGFVQLVSRAHKGRDMCDCLWFHLGKRSSSYTAQCSVSPRTRAGSFQTD